MPEWIIALNIIATFLWLFQIVFAFWYHLQVKRHRTQNIDHIPKLSVVIPAFNETDETVQQVIDSVVAQQNVEIEIFVVDDGSNKPLSIQTHSKVKLLRLEENQGKRAAQIHAVSKAKYDWIVTVDSDTVLSPTALFELYKSAYLNKWDSVTGNVKLFNEKQSLLTRMIACLYWYGFNQERASQSFFGQVSCCSGALSIWSKEVVLKTSEQYLNQKFMGRNCIAGDDRFLTCLFAREGKNTGCALDSIAYTISPHDIKGFIKQQLRWSRSTTPAFLFILKNTRKISPAFILFVMAVVFRYSYFAILYFCVLLALCLGLWPSLLIVLLSIVTVSGIKAANAFLYTRKWKMFYLMPLSIFSFLILSPVMVYGVLTPTATGWLTRSKIF